MKSVNDVFRDGRSPKGVSVFQLTNDEKGAALVYPDLPCFLHDGRRFILHGQAGPMVCNLDKGASLRPLFESPGGGRPFTVYPNGRFVAFHERQSDAGGHFKLWRMDVDTGKIELVYERAGRIPGTPIDAGKLSVATVSSDGRRFATVAFLGDGHTQNAPYGIVVIEPGRDSVAVVAEDKDFFNGHLRYCASTDPEASHDLMIQQNHGSELDEQGRAVVHLGPPCDGGADIHVVRDDGGDWRDMPWGRDGQESCIGHQLWRGGSRAGVTVTLQNADTSYGWADGTRQEVVAGWPVQTDKSRPHLGRRNAGARRVLLSEGFEGGRWCHFGLDATGLRAVLDTFPIYNGIRAGMEVWIAGARDETSPLKFRYILNSGMTFGGKRWDHAHPILSPGGQELFFNSDLTGVSQAYMVTGLEY